MLGAPRRGFLRPTSNGHALSYADGTPFFLLGDTWLGAATWRLPLTDAPMNASYEPAPGVTFQDAVAYRKRQGFNSVSMIAAFPTWAADQYPATYADSSGVYYRNAWEEFGVMVPGNQPTAKSMHDERGYRPFEIIPNAQGLPNFDRVVPEYFQSLDKKVALLDAQGFVPMLETIRRDVAPPWKAYFDFDASYARFLQYMIARYGATDSTFGTGDAAPWITMRSTGNKPRGHGIYAAMERQFHLVPALPSANMEPHYTGWVHGNNVVNGEQAESGFARDNYFSRAQMYGNVPSGALAGHVHGTGAYDVTNASEPPGARPYFWQALRYESASYMAGLRTFMLSAGLKYRELEPASTDLQPRKADGSSEKGLDGWSFLMRTPAKDLGFFYFEGRAVRARSTGWMPGKTYRFTWFDPRAGTFMKATDVTADAAGVLQLPAFPGGEEVASTDWAARLVVQS